MKLFEINKTSEPYVNDLHWHWHMWKPVCKNCHNVWKSLYRHGHYRHVFIVAVKKETWR